MTKTKKLTLLAALTAVALTIFIAEAQIPPIVPVPGVKLGLANIITMVTMLVLGRKEAGAVLIVRLILGSAFAGGFSSLMFSVAGGAAAYLVMCLLIKVFPEKLVWVVSVLAALAQRRAARRGHLGLGHAGAYRLGAGAHCGGHRDRRVHGAGRHVPHKGAQEAHEEMKAKPTKAALTFAHSCEID